MKKMYVILGLPLLLMSCSTKYGEMAFKGGYDEIQVSENVYEVEFTGNGYTADRTVSRYFLYRCAELTLEKGMRYFVFYDKSVGPRIYGIETSGGFNENGDFSSTSTTKTKSRGKGTIEMFEEAPENHPAVVYDAVIVKGELQSYIREGENTFIKTLFPF